jgi:hypothetical protein
VVLSDQVYFYSTVQRQQMFCEIFSVFIMIIPFIFTPLLSFMVMVSSEEYCLLKLSCSLVGMCTIF